MVLTDPRIIYLNPLFFQVNDMIREILFGCVRKSFHHNMIGPYLIDQMVLKIKGKEEISKSIKTKNWTKKKWVHLQYKVVSIHLDHFYRKHRSGIHQSAKDRPFVPKLHAFHNWNRKQTWVLLFWIIFFFSYLLTQNGNNTPKSHGTILPAFDDYPIYTVQSFHSCWLCRCRWSSVTKIKSIRQSVRSFELIWRNYPFKGLPWIYRDTWHANKAKWQAEHRIAYNESPLISTNN